jgi:DNA repair protein RadC
MGTESVGGAPTEYHPMMRDLPKSEKPRERMQQMGPGSLSNSDLIAILLRVGVGGENVMNLAQRLLATFGGLAGLARASLSDLCAIKGVGMAKAAQIKAALELGRRLLIAGPESRPQIQTAMDAANLLLLEMGFLPQEHMRVLLLDTKHRMLDAPTVYVGNLNSAAVRISELFRDAIKQNCAAIILAHNHPSGDPTPSTEDIAVTEQVIAAGKLLDIEVLDHLIIGQQRYVSLRERGIDFQTKR